jgi:serine protease Do
MGGLTLSDLRAEERHRTNLVARVSSAVVAVRIGGAMGSAVVISEDGLVLCAAHVCGQPGRDVVFNFPNGKTARGRTLGTNHEMDSGLMQITDPGPWPYAEVGNLEAARLGDWVLALGHPGGFDARRPIVVRLGRIIRLTTGFVQTDCTLNSGDSGGPLFDMHGRIIGIHSRISTSTAANFHVPITTFFDTWDRLAKSENWGDRTQAQAYVGVVGFSEGYGYRLNWIEEGSPAAKAGLKVGDLIVQVDGKTILGGETYVQSLKAMKPGRESEFQIKRGKQELSVRVLVELAGGYGGGPAR